jgi:segregation and condensation protein B
MAELDTNQKNTTEKAPVDHPEAAIEAILFAAGHPISYETLAETLGYKEKEIRKRVSAMTEQYDGRGFMLLAFDDTCQLCTREQFLPHIREALGIKRGGNLSASSMEVLAIVAYNQPVTRAFIDTVRGVDSSYATTSLCEKGLIEVTGHLDAPGRPALLCTTDKFLRVFGLSSLSELPPAEQLIMAPEEKGEQQEIELPKTE